MLVALLALGLATPAEAAPIDVDARFSLGAADNTAGSAGLALAHRASLGFAPGMPRLETLIVNDLSTGVGFGHHALGVRQPIGGRLSVAAHVGLLTFSGANFGYESGLGVDGVVAFDLLQQEGWGVGLVAMAGTSVPNTGLEGSWVVLGSELRFGR